jgi:pimeloyl-ACP methyl ester carboxylesterase
VSAPPASESTRAAAQPGPRRARSRWWRWTVSAYLVALIASHIVQRSADRDEDRGPRAPVEDDATFAHQIARCDDDGPVPDTIGLVAGRQWRPAQRELERGLPVVLLHGSPGSARNFDDLGPRLAASGRRAFAIDLPGFGRSDEDAPSFSIRAHAHAALEVLDARAIERAHVVGWSMGGGVALEMADLAPERIASVSLLASVGVQEGEGSGNYYFEHLKYAGMWAALIGVPDLVPHFGWIGGEPGRRAVVRNFWDTDQRPLRAILERTHVPTLILHGRDDFLVPLWTARESHELVHDSRFVTFEGTHFLPLDGKYGNLEQTLGELEPFLERHDVAGEREARAALDLTRERTGWRRFDLEPFWLALAIPWWLQVIALVLGARASVWIAAAIAGAMLAALQLDPGLALLSIAVGAALPRGSFVGRAKRAGIATLVLLATWIVGLFAASAGESVLPRTLAIGWIVLATGLALAYVRWRRRGRRTRRRKRPVAV